MKKREDIFFLFLFVHSHRIRRFTTSFPSKCKGRSLLSCHSSVGNSLCSLTQSLAVHFGQSLRDKTIYLSADDAAEADPSCRKAGREGQMMRRRPRTSSSSLRPDEMVSSPSPPFYLRRKNEIYECKCFVIGDSVCQWQVNWAQ